MKEKKMQKFVKVVKKAADNNTKEAEPYENKELIVTDEEFCDRCGAVMVLLRDTGATKEYVCEKCGKKMAFN